MFVVKQPICQCCEPSHWSFGVCWTGFNPLFAGPVLTPCLLFFCCRLPFVHPRLSAICARQVRMGPAQQPSASLPSYLITLNNTNAIFQHFFLLFF